MKNAPLFIFFLFTLFYTAVATAQTDSIEALQLDSVVVKAFEQNKRIRDIAAAVNYVGGAAFGRFGPTSIVSAVNTTPGVRMEERSPGSYRFNIRGSSLRSPFGVRNVKVYYNDLPFTDPGGQTYLNNLGFYNYGSLEVIKGPGSSLYGAGTGGVMLIDGTSNTNTPGVIAEYAAGSFGLQGLYAAFTSGNERSTTTSSYQHLQSNGFRNHSQLQRDVLSWSGRFRVNEKGELKTTFLYSDLFYQTPGALNLAEYNANPKSARPAAGAFPSAETAAAAIYQKTFLAGASYRQQLTATLSNTIVAYGAFTQLQNPAIRNYGRTNEPHVGSRSVFTYQPSLGASVLTLNAGAEWQHGFSNVSIHKNVGGRIDSLQTLDEINNRQSFVFAQANLDVKRWSFTAGASYNSMRIRFQRLAPQALPERERSFNNELAPRFAVMYKWPKVNVYSSVSKGFSPPSTSELLPTGSAINLDLQAEDGWNRDLGLKGTLMNRLVFDMNLFLFTLNNTIVQRRDAGGGEYFINAGKTKQWGLETGLQYPLWQRGRLWASHTWHHFRYEEFKQLAQDFSGNLLPGVAPQTVAAGFDYTSSAGFIAALHYYYSDRVPLNDLNTAYAPAYHLLGFKSGFQKTFKNVFVIKLMVGADNLLDQQYSLGNDVNAFGGRFYNAAAGRNFFTTLTFQWLKKYGK